MLSKELGDRSYQPKSGPYTKTDARINLMVQDFWIRSTQLGTLQIEFLGALKDTNLLYESYNFISGLGGCIDAFGPRSKGASRADFQHCLKREFDTRFLAPMVRRIVNSLSFLAWPFLPAER